MGQWGKPYKVKEWRDGTVWEKRLIAHYPVPAFQPIPEGVEPDTIRCLEERTLWSWEDVRDAMLGLPRYIVMRSEDGERPSNMIAEFFDSEKVWTLWGIPVPIDVLKQFWTPESLALAVMGEMKKRLEELDLEKESL